MSSEKSFEKFNTTQRRKVATEQTVIECNFNIESGEEPQKVLSVSACCNANGVTNGANDSVVNGNITLNVVYLTLDGLVGSQRNVCPYQVRFNQTIGNNSYAKCKVIEKNVDSVNGTNIKIVVVLETALYEIVNAEVTVLKSAGEDVCMKEGQVSMTSLVANNTQIFATQNALTVKEQIKSILSNETNLVLKEYYVGSNYISLQGDIVTRLIYVGGDDRDKICTTVLTNQFKQELELEGVTKEDKAELIACVLANEVNATVDEKENETIISVSAPVEVRIMAYRENSVVTVSDLYSLKSEANIVAESYENDNLRDCDYFESKIEGSLVLPEEELRVDKLLAVMGEGFVESNVYTANGEITIEGICFANLVYLNDDTESVNSATIEFPFVISEKAKFDTNDISVNVTLTDIDAIVKKGREVFFDGKLKVSVCYYEQEREAVITDVNFGEEYETKSYPIEIYFANAGDSLWEIGKLLKISDETLLSQNPNLTDPLEKDEKIVLYYQKNANLDK